MKIFNQNIYNLLIAAGVEKKKAKELSTRIYKKEVSRGKNNR